jgi:DNA-binding MarR family transcriptional regulator
MNDPELLTRLVGEPLDRLFRFVRRSICEAGKLHDLTPTQVRALRTLAVDGPRRLGDLATSLELSNSACSTMIDQLEKRALLVKREDPEDRRSVHAALTPEGERVAREVIHATFAELAARVGGLPVAERYMVLGGLEALSRVLD